jgi:AraC-like DNA-binding protein
VYVLKGELINKVDGVEHVLKEGSILFINYDQTHELYAKGDVAYVNLLVTTDFISQEIGEAKNIFDLFSFIVLQDVNNMRELSPVISFEGEERRDIDELFTAMLHEYENEKKNYEKVLRYYFYVLILKLVRRLETAEKEDIVVGVSDKMSSVIEYLTEHYHDDLSLGDIAEKFFYNTSYFSRLFKNTFGITFNKFLQDLRIKNAIGYICETDYAFEKIAEMVGYSDKKQFYNVFKKWTGKTPGQYRKEAKEERKGNKPPMLKTIRKTD